jgi:hypothetical protein
MPSLLHEVLIEMFRDRPALVVDLLDGALGISVPEFHKANLSPGDLTDVVPTEYRADAVVTLNVADDPVVRGAGRDRQSGFGVDAGGAGAAAVAGADRHRVGPSSSGVDGVVGAGACGWAGSVAVVGAVAGRARHNRPRSCRTVR